MIHVVPPTDGQANRFGGLLRRHRAAAGLTQHDLAEQSGLSVRGISDLERGARHFPRHDTVQRLSDALHLSEAACATLMIAGEGTTASGVERDAHPSGMAAEHGLDQTRQSLPVQLTRFVGREQELKDIQRLQRTTRLLTLTGTGGIGKTRLALEIGRMCADGYAAGIALAQLASLMDDSLVVRAVAAAVGVVEHRGEPLQTTLCVALQGPPRLLLLDNCEHLVQACAELVDALLRACPNLSILATSRQPLGVGGEVTWRVPSLSVPWPRRMAGNDSVSRYEAAQLFIDRARTVLPTFNVTDDNAAALAEPKQIASIVVRIDITSSGKISASISHCST